MNATGWRWWVVVPLVATAALLLAACGGPSTGDVEGQVLAMRDATKQPELAAGVTAVLGGNGVDCAGRADRCVTQTDAQGRYGFKGLPAGDYGIAFTYPVKDGEPHIQEEARQFNVSPGKVETVSVVLLADGIARPEVPAELAQRGQGGQAGGGGSSGSFGSGLTSNPFFWYFMFNQPWLGGYSRPPVVVYAPGPERTVVVDNSQSSPPGRSYSSYGPPGTPGTKPAPQPIQSKGVTRPGGSAALPGGSGATGGTGGTGASASAPDNGSKGVTRPGQAPAGGSGIGSGGSSGGGSSVSPPRVGGGGGGTAGRAPPRVSGGRR